MADEPRAHTPEEMRKMFLDQAWSSARSWGRVPPKDVLVDMGDRSGVSDDILAEFMTYATEGAMFSFLCILDGVSTLPAFNITPVPHSSDEQFHKDEGENWWPNDKVVNDIYLHGLYGDMCSSGMEDPEMKAKQLTEMAAVLLAQAQKLRNGDTTLPTRIRPKDKRQRVLMAVLGGIKLWTGPRREFSLGIYEGVLEALGGDPDWEGAVTQLEDLVRARDAD